MEKNGLKIAIISAFINLFLQFLLINFYGLIGAAIATSISVITYNFLKINLIRSNLKKID